MSAPMRPGGDPRQQGAQQGQRGPRGQDDRRGRGRGNLRLVDGPREPQSIEGCVPPHDLDAEAAVLSACMLSAAAINLVIDLLKQEHFYSDDNGLIWKAILDLVEEGKPVDLVTVATKLRNSDQLARVGGSSYLAQISDASPSVANVRAHAEIVYDKARRRWFIASCQHMAALGYGSEGHNDPLYISRAYAMIGQVASVGEKAGSISAREAIRSSMNKLAAASERNGRVMGISTGSKGLDELTGGLFPAEVTLICAKTKHGKSSLMRMIVTHVASTPAPMITMVPASDGSGAFVPSEQQVRQGVVIFSCEMSAEEVMDNIVCSLASVDYRAFRTGKLNDVEMQRVLSWSAWAESLPIEIVESRQITALEARGRIGLIRAQMEREGTRLSLVVFDTVQLIAEADPLLPGENEERRLNRTGKIIGDIAATFKVPVLSLSQINKDGMTKGGEVLEQHAQGKWRIHVEGVDEPMGKFPDPLKATVKLEKHRFNPPGETQMFFLRRFTRFTEGNLVDPLGQGDGR